VATRTGFTSGQAALRGRSQGSRSRSLPERGRSGVVALLALLCLGAFAAGAAAHGTHGHWVPRMHFADRVRVATVCFSVTNPEGGRSPLYGLRYTDRGARNDPSTPAIVLVHGIASSTQNWDFSPTWSVAKALAAAGYVV
jgi:hypothetical protein